MADFSLLLRKGRSSNQRLFHGFGSRTNAQALSVSFFKLHLVTIELIWYDLLQLRLGHTGTRSHRDFSVPGSFRSNYRRL